MIVTKSCTAKLCLIWSKLNKNFTRNAFRLTLFFVLCLKVKNEEPYALSSNVPQLKFHLQDLSYVFVRICSLFPLFFFCCLLVLYVFMVVVGRVNKANIREEWQLASSFHFWQQCRGPEAWIQIHLSLHVVAQQSRKKGSLAPANLDFQRPGGDWFSFLDHHWRRDEGWRTKDEGRREVKKEEWLFPIIGVSFAPPVKRRVGRERWR